MAINKQIRGLIIPVGADTTKFGKAFDESRRQVKNTTATVNELKKQLKLDPSTGNFKAAMDEAKKAVELAKDQVDLLNKAKQKLLEGEQNDKTRKSIEALEVEFAKVNTTATKAQKTLEEIEKIRLDHLTKSIKSLGADLEAAGKKLMPLSLGITGAFVGASKAAIDWETALAGVSKTTDMTGEELQTFGDSIMQLSKEIPVAANEIAGIAESAGQLGIAKENLLLFTRTMADLGATTNLTGEEAASTFARFANVARMAQSDFDRLGSAIVDLGNNLATSEREIADMAMRLAAAATQAGMTEAEIVGLAGALSSVGMEAQAGGTAFSKAINMISVSVETGSTELSEFARVAGMSASEFAKAWRDDAATAFVSFIEGLDNIERHGQSAVVLLEEMGLRQAMLRDSLTRAANAGDLFRESIERGSRAWEENTALAKEAETRYDTTASQLQIMKNRVTEIAVQLGEMLLPVLNNILKTGGDIVEWFNKLDAGTKSTILRIGGLVAALGPMLSLLGKGATSVSKLVESYGALKTATTAAAAAQQGLNVATAAFSALSVVGGIVALVGVLATFISSVKDTSDHLAILKDELKELKSAYEESEKSIRQTAIAHQGELDRVEALIPRLIELNERGLSRTSDEQFELNHLIDTANGIIPDLIGNIDELTGKYDLNSAAIYDNISALRAKYELEANEELIKEKFKHLAQLNEKLAETQTAMEEAEQELQDYVDSISDANLNLMSATDPLANTLMFLENRAEQAKRLMEEEVQSIDELKGEIDALVQAQSDLTSEINGTSAAISSATDAVLYAAQSGVAVLADELNNATESTSGLSKTFTELEGEVDNTVAAYEGLTGALDAVASGQDLSLSQIIKLINQYPELAGAVQQTATGYSIEESALRAVAQAELDRQVTSINAQIAISEAAIERGKGRIDAYREEVVALGLLTEAQAAALDDAEVMGMYRERINQLRTLAGTLAGLRDNMSGSWTSGKGSRSSSSASSSSKKKTQEELNLEAYKKHLEDIKYETELAQLERRMSSEEAAASLYESMESLRDRYLKEDSDEWRKATLEIKKYYAGLEESQKEQIRKQKEGAYQTELDDLKFERSVEIITEQKYYQQLAALQEKYLDIYGEGSREWRAIEKELHDYRKRLLDDANKAYEDAVKEHNDRLIKLQEDRIASIKAEIEAEEKRVNAIIDGIDKEIQKRRELREDEQEEDKIERARKRVEAARANLNFARDEADQANRIHELMRAQEALDEAIRDRDDTLFYRQKEAEKEYWRDYLDDYKEKAQYEIDNAGVWAAMHPSNQIVAAQAAAQAAASSTASWIPQLLQNKIVSNVDSRNINPQLFVQNGGVAGNSQLIALLQWMLRESFKI